MSSPSIPQGGQGGLTNEVRVASAGACLPGVEPQEFTVLFAGARKHQLPLLFSAAFHGSNKNPDPQSCKYVKKQAVRLTPCFPVDVPQTLYSFLLLASSCWQIDANSLRKIWGKQT